MCDPVMQLNNVIVPFYFLKGSCAPTKVHWQEVGAVKDSSNLHMSHRFGDLQSHHGESGTS